MSSRSRNSAYAESLSYAAEALGGVEGLAARLGVDRSRLSAWLAGDDAPPPEVFMAALDIISARPYLRRR